MGPAILPIDHHTCQTHSQALRQLVEAVTAYIQAIPHQQACIVRAELLQDILAMMMRMITIQGTTAEGTEAQVDLEQFPIMVMMMIWTRDIL